MSVWSVFTQLKGAISNGDDTNPETSSVFTDGSTGQQYNVIAYRRETVPLDVDTLRTINILNYNDDDYWHLIVARVVGSAKLRTIGVDADDSTAVTGYTGGYGTANYPGVIGIVTTYLTASSALIGLADDTTVEYIACILAADDDL